MKKYELEKIKKWNETRTLEYEIFDQKGKFQFLILHSIN